MKKGRLTLFIFPMVWFLAIASLIASIFLLFAAGYNPKLFLPTAACSLGCFFFWSFSSWKKKGDLLKPYNLGILSIFSIFLVSSAFFVHFHYSSFPGLRFWLSIIVLAILSIFVFWAGIKSKKKLLKYAGQKFLKYAGY